MSVLIPSVDRRSFMKWSGAVAGTTALVGSVAYIGMPGATSASAEPAEGMAEVDKTVWSACTVNCGSRCPVRLQIKDGVIVRVLADNTGSDEIGG